MDNLKLKRRIGKEPYREAIPDIQPGNNHYPCPLPGHNQPTDTQKPDFRINLHDGHYRWFCTCGKGDIVDFWQKLRNITSAEAILELQTRYGDGNFSSERPNPDKPEKEKSKITASEIYNKFSVEDAQIISKYLKTRNINLTENEIKDFGIKLNPYCIKKEGIESFITYPIRTVNGGLISVGKIPIDEKCCKVSGTRLHGKLTEDCCYSFNPGKENCCIVEGIEDALTLYLEHENGKNYTYLVTSSAQNFNKVSSFLNSFKKRILILDSDQNSASVKASECLKQHEVTRLMSTYRDYKDANEALLKGEFQAWAGGLKMIEYQDDNEGQESNNDDETGNNKANEFFNSLPDFDYLIKRNSKVYPIIEGLLYRNCAMMLSGGSGSGKTLFVLNMLTAASNNKDFLGLKTYKHNFVYVDYEKSDLTLEAWAKQLKFDKGIKYIQPGKDYGNGLTLSRINDNKDIEKTIKFFNAFPANTVFCIDVLRKMHSFNENDSRMESITDIFVNLKHKYSFILNHHTGKNDQYRGSTSILGDCDIHIEFGYDEKSKIWSLNKDKSRYYFDGYKDFPLQFKAGDNGYFIVNGKTGKADKDWEKYQFNAEAIVYFLDGKTNQYQKTKLYENRKLIIDETGQSVPQKKDEFLKLIDRMLADNYIICDGNNCLSTKRFGMRETTPTEKAGYFAHKAKRL